MKKIIISILLMLTVSISFAGQCTTVDCVINGLMPHMSSIMNLYSTISYIVGIVFTYKAISKLKEHNESKGQVKLATPILLFIAAGLLFSLPSVISVGRQTTGVTGQYDNQSAIVNGSRK